mmetsp:Transcript_8223/g.24647  ORF Transcript_8223/g.24647 Transcript_8223/m.24647 type:complete len:210 (-) Transcript_8223:980-1609(-)
MKPPAVIDRTRFRGDSSRPIPVRPLGEAEDPDHRRPPPPPPPRPVTPASPAAVDSTRSRPSPGRPRHPRGITSTRRRWYNWRGRRRRPKRRRPRGRRTGRAETAAWWTIPSARASTGPTRRRASRSTVRRGRRCASHSNPDRRRCRWRSCCRATMNLRWKPAAREEGEPSGTPSPSTHVPSVLRWDVPFSSPPPPSRWRSRPNGNLKCR